MNQVEVGWGGFLVVFAASNFMAEQKLAFQTMISQPISIAMDPFDTSYVSFISNKTHDGGEVVNESMWLTFDQKIG